MLGLVMLGLLGWSSSDTASAGNDNKPRRLIVIAPKRFHPALEDFIKFKKRLLPTELVALETVLKSSSGVDDPEKVKRYLYQEWRRHHVGYALLVGDAEVFPVRYMVLDRVTPAAFDYAFYPSDLYYADLAKPDGSFDDWNVARTGFHAGYFGEVRGEKNKTDPINYDAIDYRPEIAVGRWPVNSVEDLQRVAAKSMRYENQRIGLSATNDQRVVWMGVGGWVDCRSMLDKLASIMPTGWTSEKRYYKDGHDYGTLPPTHAELLKLLNEGVGMVCHTGHGQDMGWDQCFDAKDLSVITNADHLPVMISIGCSTARFATLPPYEPYVDVDGKTHEGSDHGEVFTSSPTPPACYQKGRYNPPGLGKQLLRAGDNGAVAYIGCNTGAQPCALTLLEGFITALSKQSQPRLGDCWSQALSFYYDNEHLATIQPTADWYPASIFFQGMKFMLYGDPSLAMDKIK
jgi:hypothetical protein